MFDKASLKLGLDKAVLQSMSMKDNVGGAVSKVYSSIFIFIIVKS